MLVLLAEDHFEELEQRRRAWGVHDEVWSGIPHLSPVGRHSRQQQATALLLRPAARERGLIPVLGAYEPADFDQDRVPDAGVPRLRRDQASTAALAVEIITGRDDTAQRLALFAAGRVTEVVVLDLDRHAVDWFELAGDEYQRTEMSQVIDLGPARLAEMITLPTPDEQ